MAVDIDGVNSTISTDKLIPQSGTALQIGDASDVITIPASATITNLGTATGFGGGAWNFIHTATASGSSTILEFKHGTGGVVMDSTYSIYVFMLKNIVPASGSVDLRFYMSTDTGSTWLSNVQFVSYGRSAEGTIRGTESTSSSTGAVLAYSTRSTTTAGQSGQLMLVDPSNASGYGSANWQLGFNSNQNIAYFGYQTGGCMTTTQGDVDAVKFAFASGNIASGEIRMYGISDS
jgi:hypothetical protein